MSFQRIGLSRNWGKNWSGRGTALLDKMESREAYTRVKTDYLTPIMKLKRLASKYPYNKFYKSLLKWIKTSSLSKRQIECIEENYNKYFPSVK